MGPNIFQPDAQRVIPATTMNEIATDFADAGLELPPGSRPGSSTDPPPSDTKKSRLWSTTIVAMVNGTRGTLHLDVVTEPNVIRSVAMTGRLPPMFNPKDHIEDAYDIEYFENPEELAYGNNSKYNEYNNGLAKTRCCKNIFRG